MTWNQVPQDWNTLSRTVEANKTEIKRTLAEFSSQATTIEKQRSQLGAMEERLDRLENGKASCPPRTFTSKSKNYLSARRLLKLWPNER